MHTHARTFLNGFCCLRDNFRLCFTSQFSLDDIDEFLFETEALPPRENFQIIYIEPEIEKK